MCVPPRHLTLLQKRRRLGPRPVDRSRPKATAFLEKREMPGRHAHASGGLMGEFGDKFARMPTESGSGKVRGLPNMTLIGR
mgnify:CR=1 FL=1